MKFKIECFYSFICISSAMFLLTGCGGEIYTETTYGGSFLIDSLTVGFIKTVNTIREVANAWDGGDYIDGEQSLQIYSVPQKRITKSIRIASGSEASLMGPAMTVTFSNPWMMYENDVDIYLFNINTREKIKIASSVFYFGGLSPDGQYAFYNKGDKRVEGGKIPGTTYFYSTSEKRVTDSVQISTIFYLAKNKQFFLFTLAEDPLYSNKDKWIVRSDFNNNSPENWDTLLTLPDTLGLGNITNFYQFICLVWMPPHSDLRKPLFFDLNSLFDKKLVFIFSTDYMNNTNMNPPVADFCSETGVYTNTSGSKVIIRDVNKIYTDTIFQENLTWE